MTREEILSDLVAVRKEMSLVRAEVDQPAPARPPHAQFTQEELLAAAEKNVWVKMNIVVPQVAARRKPKG